MNVQVTTYSLETGEFESVISAPSHDILANVPDGFGAMAGRWDGSEWRVENGEPVRKAKATPAITAAQVDGEARRRIVARYPEWKQMNVIREGGEALAEMSGFIDGIRAKGKALKARQRIPSTFRDDRYWS